MKTFSRFALGACVSILSLTMAVPFAFAATLTSAQVTSILSVLRSFGATDELVESTRAVLEERATVQVSAPGSESAAGCYSFTRWMMVGTLDEEVGGDVSRLQTLLTTLGYYASDITGKFGAFTEAAVKKFQTAKGVISSGDINSTGFGGVGPATREALSKASCSPASSAGAPPAIPAEPIVVLSPDLGGSFILGQPIRISWSGGSKPVQLGLVDKKYEADSSVLGWIAINEVPNGSLAWDGEKVSDLTGTVKQNVSSLSSGPYKIIAVAAGADGSHCVHTQNGCKYDVSNSYFTLIPPSSLGILAVSCTPSIAAAPVGTSLSWEAVVSNGTPPYTYQWNGSDNIAALPPRLEGKALDVSYRAVGSKTAAVTIRDANGKTGFAPCSFPVSITPALSPLTLFSPNGGERFMLTKTFDPSQFVRVSWQLREPPPIRKDDTILISLQDVWGRTCTLGSAPRTANDAFIALVDGYQCQNDNWRITPGQYKIRVSVAGREAAAFDVSDTDITLTAPTASDVQLIVPSATAVGSNEKVTFSFAFPPHALKGSLFLSCPYGVTASIPNACNAYTDVTSYAASSTGYSLAFSNSNSQEQTVTANFYVSLPNNPNHKRGISAQVVVRPLPSAAGVSGDDITILAPNGGEKIQFGVPFIYRFKYNQFGALDLMLVPYPPVDAGQVCQIASGAALSPGTLTLSLKESGGCIKGPSKIAAGSYTLRAVLQSGGAMLASDMSDSFFTVGVATSTATSTGAQ